MAIRVEQQLDQTMWHGNPNFYIVQSTALQHRFNLVLESCSRLLGGSGSGFGPCVSDGDQNFSGAELVGAASGAPSSKANCFPCSKAASKTEPNWVKWERPRDLLQDCATASNQGAKVRRAQHYWCNQEDSCNVQLNYHSAHTNIHSDPAQVQAGLFAVVGFS